MKLDPKILQRELQKLNDTLKELRGYVSKFPDDKKVVVVFSGGLDSVSVIARCLIDFDLEIFPVSISRGQSNLSGERRSSVYFDKYFLEKFPEKYHPIKYISLNIPPIEIKDDIKNYADQYGYPLRDNVLVSVAVQYAASLWPKHGEIKTILTGIVPEDIYPHSSLLSMRSATLMTCLSTPFTNWNISSINVDPYLYGDKGPFGKENEIRWCADNDIPIHLSRTCNMSNNDHCGECSSCHKRHISFIKAGVIDKTKYEKPIS